MIKIVLDAGHGINTPGKRTPDGEREWTFNNQVVLAAIAKLNEYENVQILRVDDPTGKTDVSLNDRTDKANTFKADVYVSCHHNAYTGNWGSWTGVETYTFDHAQANPKSVEIAKVIHPLVVNVMGLRDRGLKKANFHVLRETAMPAILIEAGFMDSSIDIVALRDNAKLIAQGEAVAKGLATYFGLKLKKEKDITLTDLLVLTTGEGRNALLRVLKRFEKKDPALGKIWRDKVENGTFTQNDSHEVFWVAVDRGYITGNME